MFHLWSSCAAANRLRRSSRHSPFVFKLIIMLMLIYDSLVSVGIIVASSSLLHLRTPCQMVVRVEWMPVGWCHIAPEAIHSLGYVYGTMTMVSMVRLLTVGCFVHGWRTTTLKHLAPYVGFQIVHLTIMIGCTLTMIALWLPFFFSTPLMAALLAPNAYFMPVVYSYHREEKCEELRRRSCERYYSSRRFKSATASSLVVDPLAVHRRSI